MSRDEVVSKILMKTLEDGQLGFQKAARLTEAEYPLIASRLSETALQRFDMCAGLQAAAASHNITLAESGTAAATVHRGWLTIADVLAGDSIEAVKAVIAHLRSCMQP